MKIEPRLDRPPTEGPGRVRVRSRREFLRDAGLLAGGFAASGLLARGGPADQPACAFGNPPQGQEAQAAPYSFPAGGPRRARRSLGDVVNDPAALAQLVAAYGALKDLAVTSPGSPINWCSQANIHYNHCSLGAGAFYLQVHYGWLFLPWHRGYLYFYETLLGSLVGDPAFALPYWDWTTTPVVPDAFFDPSGPLYDPGRSIGPGQSIAGDPEVFYYTQRPFVDYLQALPGYSPPPSSPTSPSFGGPPDFDESTPQYQGSVEAGPHDAVHSWVGGDMGSFDTAARDLLFFGHHANIDRLWSTWQQAPGHANPAAPAWLNQWFNFWDSGGNPASMTVADSINPQALNVVYQPPTAPAPAARASILAAARPGARQEGFVAEGTPITLPLPSRARPLSSTERVTPASGGELHLEGVEAPQGPGVRLRVFVNKPDAGVTTPLDDPAYVGTVFVVPMRSEPAMPGHAATTMHAHNYRLVVPRAHPALANPGADAKVTVVPVRRGDKPAGGQVKLKSAALVRPR